MKKNYRVCNAFVGYDYRKVYSISIMTKQGDLVKLVEYDKDSKNPYQYSNYYEMYEGVLKLMRSYGFNPNYQFKSGARFYNIVWYNITNPTSHFKLGLPVFKLATQLVTEE